MSPERIPAPVLDALRARLRDEVAATVRLTRSGRTWRGLCPFHRERTPSFHVYPGARPAYHCYGCGAHGDIFTWLARTRGLDFAAALSYLDPTVRAGPAAHRPRAPASDPAPAAASDARDPPEGWTDAACVDVLSLAVGHYHAQLLAHRPALEYLNGRGLDAATIARRRLGYTPVDPAPYDALAFALRHHRLDGGLARRVGLLGPDGRERLAGRIIFPERRADGVVWLSGRAFRDPATSAIDLAGRPKYLGLPLPPGHRKPLLGWSAAQGQAVIGVVEGPVDQALLADVLGLGGAGVGPAVIRRFARFDRLYLALDRDRAGRRARAAFIAALGPRVTPVLIPRDARVMRRYFAAARRIALVRVVSDATTPAARRRAAALADHLAGLIAALDRLPAPALRRPLGDAAALIEHLPDGAACLLALAEIARARPAQSHRDLTGRMITPPAISPGSHRDLTARPVGDSRVTDRR